MNPRIVYASITAFGQHGPVREAARLRHARAGDQRLHEHQRVPRRAADALRPVDLRLLRGHALRVQHRVGAALSRPHRARASASTSRCSTACSWRWTTSASATPSAASCSRARATSRSAARAPASIPTTDGHVAIAAGTSDAVWRRFCEIIGRAELTTRSASSRPCRRGATAGTRSPRSSGRGRGTRSQAEVVKALAEAGVPAAPVNNVAEMVADPQVQAREMFVELDHPTYGPLTITGHAAQAVGDAGPHRAARAGRASTTRRSSSACSATRARTWRAGRRRA